MNLINKKLKDKLKIFDDIDTQFLINLKNKNSHIEKSNNNNNLNSIEILKNATNEKFDKIYSDFLLNENKYSFYNGQKDYSMRYFNNLDKSINEDKKEKERNNDSSKKSFSYKELLNNNGEQKEHNQNKNEVVQRLYDYGKYLMKV